MDLLKQQFAIDFNCEPEVFEREDSFFTTAKSSPEARYWARGFGDIICFNDRIFCRTEDTQVTECLKKEFHKMPGQWFFEMENIVSLQKILQKFDLKINNISPFFIPQKKSIEAEKQSSKLRFFSPSEIQVFQQDKRIKEAFCYDKNDPDMLGVGYYHEGELKAIAGANHNGKHTWEIGIEVLDNRIEKQGIAAMLVRQLTAEIHKQNPLILPVYGTQFSHIRSMNVAIRAGFLIGWSEIMIGKV